MTEQELASLVDQRAEEKITAKMAEIQTQYKSIFDGARDTEAKRGQKAQNPGLMLARVIRTAAAVGGDAEKALAFSKAVHSEDKELQGYFQKALEVGTPTAGGFTVPQVLADQTIELLYPNVVLTRMGVERVPMPNGNVRMARMNTGSNVSYFGETKKVAKTTPDFGQVVLSGKKLGALVPISNDLLRSNSVSVDAWVLRDLQKQFALKMDVTAFYGAGTAYVPNGISNLIDSTMIVGSNSTAFTTDIPFQLLSLLESQNVMMVAPFWVMHPILKNYIANLKATTGEFIFRDEISRGTLLGIPLMVTTQISYTAGSPGHTDIWLGDFSEFIWGDQMTMEVQVSREASFDDGGTQVSAFQQDLTLTRVIGVHDFNIKHDKSFVKGTYKLATS